VRRWAAPGAAPDQRFNLSQPPHAFLTRANAFWWARGHIVTAGAAADTGCARISRRDEAAGTRDTSGIKVFALAKERLPTRQATDYERGADTVDLVLRGAFKRVFHAFTGAAAGDLAASLRPLADVDRCPFSRHAGFAHRDAIFRLTFTFPFALTFTFTFACSFTLTLTLTLTSAPC
jgi:hypothetical protein